MSVSLQHTVHVMHYAQSSGLHAGMSERHSNTQLPAVPASPLLPPSLPNPFLLYWLRPNWPRPQGSLDDMIMCFSAVMHHNLLLLVLAAAM